MITDFRQTHTLSKSHGSERQKAECAARVPKNESANGRTPSLLDAPSDYGVLHQQPLWCDQRPGLPYLESLCYSAAQYCTSESKSQLTCFHSKTSQDGRIDPFCVGHGVALDQASSTFRVSCQLAEPQGIYSDGPTIALQDFPGYWYDTGPRTIMNKFVDLTTKVHEGVGQVSLIDQSFTILLKREGAGNLWHCLMEMMSLSWTLDVLQMSPDPSRQETGRPFLSPGDASNTQVVILDDAPDGPYFELWHLFAQKPTVRLAELPAGTDVGHIIIPLPGGSNPVWQGDWEPNTCEHSELLGTFSRRVLKFLDISDHRKYRDDSPQQNRNIIVTFIERRGTRKLVDMDQHVAALRSRLHAHTEIRVLNMESLPLAEQVQSVRDSDVLVGVHGAGLTHAIWLRKHSVVVEILPAEFQHKGFRNLAGALGHGYFSAHGTRVPGAEADWQTGDVAIDRETLVELMDVAVKSIYNRGEHIQQRRAQLRRRPLVVNMHGMACWIQFRL